jgi:hypothetical protein
MAVLRLFRTVTLQKISSTAVVLSAAMLFTKHPEVNCITKKQIEKNTG